MRTVVDSELSAILLAVGLVLLLLTILGLRRIVRQRLAQRAIKDPLTGTYTADFIQEVYHAELRRAERTGVPFSLALVALNDPSGHGQLAGSPDVSMAMAKWLRRNVRSSDYIGRLEDNRFALVLPETWEEDAKVVAARIKGSFRYQPKPTGSERWLTCNVGAATWTPENPDVWSGATKGLGNAAVAASAESPAIS